MSHINVYTDSQDSSDTWTGLSRFCDSVCSSRNFYYMSFKAKQKYRANKTDGTWPENTFRLLFFIDKIKFKITTQYIFIKYETNLRLCSKKSAASFFSRLSYQFLPSVRLSCRKEQSEKIIWTRALLMSGKRINLSEHCWMLQLKSLIQFAKSQSKSANLFFDTIKPQKLADRFFNQFGTFCVW
jgi:hypothetical protein